MKPRLTIAIPTVNRANLLGRAVDSALAQTSREIEIIVSDNGSTDETPQVIASYAGRGLRTFRHPETINAARHGQFLMEQARGEFFLGLSDDDFLEPGFATEVLALFDRHPELSFVYTGCAVHYEDCQVPALVGPAVEAGPAFLTAHYQGAREVSWCACVTRVRDLLELGPQPDDRILGDMFFWTKLAFRGPVGCVPRILSHYILLRPHNENISHGTRPLTWAREQRVLADEILQSARRAGCSTDFLSQMAVNCKAYIARSTANQFVWTRIRGASLLQAWRWAIGALPYVGMSPQALTRLAAASLLPRALLRRMLLSAAARMARTRAQEEPAMTSMRQ